MIYWMPLGALFWSRCTTIPDAHKHRPKAIWLSISRLRLFLIPRANRIFFFPIAEHESFYIALLPDRFPIDFRLFRDASSTVFRNELDFHIDQVLKPRLCNLGVDWFERGGDENWDSVIKDALSQRELEMNRQWVYTLRAAQKTLTLTEAVDDYR